MRVCVRREVPRDVHHRNPDAHVVEKVKWQAFAGSRYMMRCVFVYTNINQTVAVRQGAGNDIYLLNN